MSEFNFTTICKRYYDYSTDASPRFGEIMGIQLLGHAMGYDTVNLIQPEAVHHNMYVLLVGDSTLTRKSTSQRLARKIYPMERQIPFESSPEQLWVEISKVPEAIQFLGEFSGLLKGITRGGWLTRIAEFYNDMHECPIECKRSLRKRRDEENEWTIKKGYLSLSSTITPEVLKEFLTEELTVGGFLARWLMVNGVPRRRPRQLLHPDILKSSETLRNILEAIINMKKDANFVLSPEALKRYDELDNIAITKYPNSLAFAGRYLNYLVAISDILLLDDFVGKAIENDKIHEYKSLSELLEAKEGKVVVPSEYLDRAWNIIEPCISHANEIVNYILCDKATARLREVIKKWGRITRSDALRYSHLSAKQVNEAIATLEQSDQVTHTTEDVVVKGSNIIKKVWYEWKG